MFVNLIHSLLHRVENGWDPISPEYAKEYDSVASREMDAGLAERLDSLSGGLTGKKVLDLGGGPGHYSILFAKLGANVTWHDPSRVYQQIAKARAAANGVTLDFSLGYLEDARKFGQNTFDLVFCRVCWYYSRGDRGFSRLLYGLLKPGGLGYIECNTPSATERARVRGLQSWLNEYLWFKIGHPLPPRGRIAMLIHRYPTRFLEAESQSKNKDIVVFIKA